MKIWLGLGGHMQMSMRNPDADPHLYKIFFTILNK